MPVELDIQTVSIIASATVGLGGIFVSGVFGPRFSAKANRRANRERFDHERGLKSDDFEQARRLKASDDLVARIDDVAVALDVLIDACGRLRTSVLLKADDDLDAVWARMQNAESAYNEARATIARLAMRPHADSGLVEKAREATAALTAATSSVRLMLSRRLAAERALGGGVGPPLDMSTVTNTIEHGDEVVDEYRGLARIAVGRLIGPVDRHPAASTGPQTGPRRP